MREDKEIREAIDACDRVIGDIDQALADLSSASKWSMLDILGGEFIASFAKSSKIKSANKKISSVKLSLDVLDKELRDVGMDLPAEISDSFGDNFFDLFFDNIFTDLRVRGEIKDKVAELKDLRSRISYIKDQLRKSLS